MRIAIIVNEFPTNSETFITNKVLWLISNGHQLHIFCTSVNKQLWNKYFGDNKNAVATILDKKSFLNYSFKHPSAAIQYLFGRHKEIFFQYCADKINQCSAGIVHFEFSGLGIVYLIVLDKIKGKKVVSCRGSAEKVKLLSEIPRREKIKQLFDKVDAIHCVSEDMQKTILPYCNQPGKIFINCPSIDFNFFTRTRPYADQPTINILSIGRLTFQKGYLTGLLAIKQLKDHNLKFQWIIIGDGPQKEEILFHINQLGLQGAVLLAGIKSKEEIIELYHEASIFFLPSVYEGIANVALEAMSMELPVVATNCGGMAEVITHEVNGMLADVYDSNQLAKHLLRLITNFENRKELGIKAREVIINKFTIQQNIEVYEKIYTGLINESFNDNP